MISLELSLAHGWWIHIAYVIIDIMNDDTIQVNSGRKQKNRQPDLRRRMIRPETNQQQWWLRVFAKAELKKKTWAKKNLFNVIQVEQEGLQVQLGYYDDACLGRGASAIYEGNMGENYLISIYGRLPERVWTCSKTAVKAPQLEKCWRNPPRLWVVAMTVTTDRMQHCQEEI